MDYAFAISQSGFADTIVRPAAFAFALAGGLVLPGAQIEAGMHHAPRPGAPDAMNFAPRTSPFEAAPDPDSPPSANALRAPVSDHVAIVGARPETVFTRKTNDLTIAAETPGGFAAANRSTQPLTFSRAFSTELFPVSEAQGPDDILPGREQKSEAAITDSAALVSRPEVHSATGEFSAHANTDMLDLIAYDPFASKGQQVSELATTSTLSPGPDATGKDVVSNALLQPVIETEPAKQTAPSAPPAWLATTNEESSRAKPSGLVAPAPAKTLAGEARANPASGRSLPVPAAQAKSPMPLGLVTPKPLSPPKVVSGRHMPGYRHAGDVIEFTLSTSVNGEPGAAIPLRVTKDDRLWLRAGDLLMLVKAKMSEAEYNRLSSASAIQEYVTFETVRSAGISLKYDAARNQIAVGID